MFNRLASKAVQKFFTFNIKMNPEWLVTANAAVLAYVVAAVHGLSTEDEMEIRKANFNATDEHLDAIRDAAERLHLGQDLRECMELYVVEVLDSVGKHTVRLNEIAGVSTDDGFVEPDLSGIMDKLNFDYDNCAQA